MNGWEIIWDQRAAMLEGFVNTLILFGVGAVGAFLLGAFTLVLLEGKDTPARRVLRMTMDAMRMLPFLIYAYLLYYGLPALGLRLDAWTAGLLALVTYHAAYFGEIFQGARAALPRGQIEAAHAHGFSTWIMVRRLIFPQVVMQSSAVMNNQLIICLKDTAFLSILTVQELTATASSIQSTYYIPMQAFVVALALYWMVTLALGRVEKKLGRIAIAKGIVNEH